ncbi:MAG TPA: MFS transporter [Dehalococcoidia bacterium]|nr:MFS transporter [Dehalococcoidia bacterium]
MIASGSSTNALTRRFPAFESVDYRRLWMSSGFSAASSWMLILARGWLVFELSDSTTAVGIVTFAGFIPLATVGPLGGALADRFDRRRLAVFSTLGVTVAQLVLAALALSGTIEVWQVTVIALLGGSAGSLGLPAQDAILPSLLRRPDHLLNGVALAGIARHGSRLLGPTFGAALLATAGAGYAFLLAAAFLSLSAWQLYRISFRPNANDPVATSEKRTSFWRGIMQDLAQGVAYIERDPRLVLVVVLVTLHCALTMAFDSMMPTLATIVGGASRVYGATIVGLGVGAVVGTIVLSMLGNTPVKGASLAAAGVVSGVAMVVMGVAPTPAIVIVGAILAGGSQSAFVVLSTTFIQQITADAFRGRVLSIYTMLTVGHMAFLNFGFGWVADGVGVRVLLIVPGLLWVALFGIAVLLLPELRHVLRRGDFRPRSMGFAAVPDGE